MLATQVNRLFVELRPTVQLNSDVPQEKARFSAKDGDEKQTVRETYFSPEVTSEAVLFLPL